MLENLGQNPIPPPQQQIDEENSPEKKYQDRVWDLPTDEDIKRLTKEIDVRAFADPVNSVENARGLFKDNPEILQRSGTNRLIDLGSGGYVSSDLFSQFAVEEMGFKEYIEVDLNIKESEFRERDDDPIRAESYRGISKDFIEPIPGKRLRIRSLKGEILTALHSFPDNYGNVWMTGIEAGNIIRNYENWGFALLAELKRVVPENGLIITDKGFINEMISRCIPSFDNVIDKVGALDYNLGRLTGEEKQKIKEALKEYEVKEGDPFYGEIKYAIDAPEIGFKIYIENGSGTYGMFILVNTKKEKTVKSS